MMVLSEAAALNRKLKQFGYAPIYHSGRHNDGRKRQPDHIVEAFVDSLENLESLALTPFIVNQFTNSVELLNRLGLRCTNLKHLKLYQINSGSGDITAIKHFQTIESLIITICGYDFRDLSSLVGGLPLLRRLYIGVYGCNVEWSDVKTNRKCSQLVDSFVQQHSRKRGTFTITDEFFNPHNAAFKRLKNAGLKIF